MNKKSPGARGVPQPFKPATAQLKTAVSAQGVRRPVAPPVYRPQATPSAAVQPAMAAGGSNRRPPAAPPAYRPQQTPKVLQAKTSPRQPAAPPVYRPEAKKLVQPKALSQPRTSPTAPPVYRPEQRRVAQPKMAPAARPHTPPPAPPIARPQAKPVGAQAKMVGPSHVKNHSPATAARRTQPVTSAGALNPSKPVIQGYFLLERQGVFMAQEARKTETGKTFLAEGGRGANIRVSFKESMRVSNDGRMAIEDGYGKDRQSKTFYADPTVVTAANTLLRNMGSPIRLASNDRIGIRVPNIDGTREHDLLLTYPLDLRAKKIGHEVTIPQRCNEAGPYVGHTEAVDWLEPNLKASGSMKPPKGVMLSSVDKKLAVLLPLYLKQKRWLAPTTMSNLVEQISLWWSHKPTNIPTDIGTVERSNANTFSQFLESKSGTYAQGVNDAAREYVEYFLASPDSKPILKELGLNEYVNPSVGDILSIRSIGQERYEGKDWYLTDYASGRELKKPFGYHFATVVAKSGGDYLTMENYARGEEEGDSDHPLTDDDPRYFFQMFGPREQSFHAELRKDFPNAMTLSFSPVRGTENYGDEVGKKRVGRAIAEYNRKLDWINEGPQLRWGSIQ